MSEVRVAFEEAGDSVQAVLYVDDILSLRSGMWRPYHDDSAALIEVTEDLAIKLYRLYATARQDWEDFIRRHTEPGGLRLQDHDPSIPAVADGAPAPLPEARARHFLELAEHHLDLGHTQRAQVYVDLARAWMAYEKGPTP